MLPPEFSARGAGNNAAAEAVNLVACGANPDVERAAAVLASAIQEWNVVLRALAVRVVLDIRLEDVPKEGSE